MNIAQLSAGVVFTGAILMVMSFLTTMTNLLSRPTWTARVGHDHGRLALAEGQHGIDGHPGQSCSLTFGERAPTSTVLVVLSTALSMK